MNNEKPHPTKNNPIEVLEFKERWKSPDGTVLERNLDVKDKDYTWLSMVRNGRFKAKIIRKRFVRAIAPEKNQGGFYAEMTFENILMQLEMGIKKNNQWENIRMTFSPLEVRNLQLCLDGLENFRQVFDDANPRGDMQ